MYPFVDMIPESDLLSFVNKELVIGSEYFSDNKSSHEIKLMLFSIFGYDGLYSKKLRMLLLLNCDIDQLRPVANRLLNIDINIKQYDLAVELSILSWRAGAKIVDVFNELFLVPDVYFPQPTPKTFRNEVVEPLGKSNDLFDYQIEVKDKILDFLCHGKSNSAMVQLPTGSGKTRTTMESISARLKNREYDKPVCVLWLAHTEELCSQASDSFKKTWTLEGTFGVELLRFWGGAKLPLRLSQASFVVAGYVKFVKSVDDIITMLQGEVILVVDEAHKALAPTVSAAIEKLSNSVDFKLIGLSATPGRAVNNTWENKGLSKIFSSNLITSEILGAKPISYLQSRGVLSVVRRETCKTDYDVDVDCDSLSDGVNSVALKRLAEDHGRNMKIVRKILQCERQGRKVIVFACSVGHAKKLGVMLASEGVGSCTIDCEMRSNNRALSLSAFSSGEVSVILNFGVLSTGIDVPNISAVILARPTTSIVLYSQMIGRGLRGVAVGGSEDCLVVDVVDNESAYGNFDDVYNFFSGYWN